MLCRRRTSSPACSNRAKNALSSSAPATAVRTVRSSRARDASSCPFRLGVLVVIKPQIASVVASRTLMLPVPNRPLPTHTAPRF